MRADFTITPLEIVMLAQNTPHSCMDHLEWQEASSTEPHGEHFDDSGYRCALCGERFSLDDLAAIADAEDIQ
jgi:hypothetical protein